MYKSPSILFINKQRPISNDPGDWGYSYESCGKSSGLANSVNMVVAMLRSIDITVNAEEALDNNSIDRLVTQYSPDIVIIEALWVVPSKFEILHKLHPKVRWIIRLHSELPFIANEGIAMGWLLEYVKQKEYITIAANSPRMQHTLTNLLGVEVAYLPNYYTCDRVYADRDPTPGEINISCFGAIRPLKNHLAQAVAAILFANEHNMVLRFHINNTRIEGNGGSILKNLRALFPEDGRHSLVEHDWYTHDQFKQIIRDQIDIGMQVSFTESYNIVAADHIDCNVPMVTSPEITFVAWPYTAGPTDIEGMAAALTRSQCMRRFTPQRINNVKLDALNRRAVYAWWRLL